VDFERSACANVYFIFVTISGIYEVTRRLRQLIYNICVLYVMESALIHGRSNGK